MHSKKYIKQTEEGIQRVPLFDDRTQTWLMIIRLSTNIFIERENGILELISPIYYMKKDLREWTPNEKHTR